MRRKLLGTGDNSPFYARDISKLRETAGQYHGQVKLQQGKKKKSASSLVADKNKEPRIIIDGDATLTLSRATISYASRQKYTLSWK